MSISDAARASDILGRLIERSDASRQCLLWVRPCVPAALHEQLRPGPLDDGNWCLLVPGNAVAAKIRQYLPTLLQQLARQGAPVTSIRIKIVRP